MNSWDRTSWGVATLLVIGATCFLTGVIPAAEPVTRTRTRTRTRATVVEAPAHWPPVRVV